MKCPWVSDWMIWVAMECSRHDLSIFLWTLTTWSGFCDPQIILDYDDSPSMTSEREPHHLNQFCPKTNCTLWDSSAYQYKSFSSVVDHWVLTPAAVEICMATKTISYIAPSTLSCERYHPLPCLTAIPEPNILGMMDRSWRLHSMATQITQCDTHGLFILGIRERKCVHTTHASGPSRASWQDC
jgi:hypothetical protein